MRFLINRLANGLEKEVYQAVKLLSIGTFLEYFDLFLYAHMAILLNSLFFAPADAHAQNLLGAFAFCTSFVFRPFGAMLFGYIGDKYGRKITIIITTFMMACTCLVMANAPTYAQVGVAAAWIVTACRIVQGMSSMGEIVGAQLFLTEATPLSNRFVVVGLISIFADLGGIVALCVGALSTGYGFNWRIAFWIGAGVALIGSLARRGLRESPEYADGCKRVQRIADRAHESLENLKNSDSYNEKVEPKLSLSYFLIKCAGPAFVYFVYFYSTNLFKDTFQYATHNILIHNLLVGLVQLFFFSILRTYLSNKIHPLKIVRFSWMIISIFIFFVPFLLNHITAPWQLFLIQSFMIVLGPGELPAGPIFYKNFPVYKRFSYISILFALAGAFIYTLTTYGLTYLIGYFGYWGLLILMVPILIGYGYGLHYFINLEKAQGKYPSLPMWRELKNGETEIYYI